ncbi:MAG TPA: hypothetical protein VN461_11440 [Vicinamibacteria bacterium]|jgi:hypothetical protein|nr:hypothetical protein [Vicinamibacteria bacterium]
MRKTLAACLLLAIGNAAAQPFNRIYNTVDLWDFAISICPTEDGGYALLGFSGFQPTSTTILTRLAPNGKVLWAHSYGRNIWRVVRQTRDGGFVLFGDSPMSTDPSRIVPKIIKLDAKGVFRWGQEFLITNADGTPGTYAQGVALAVDPLDGSFLVGGTFYSQPFIGYEPWLGKVGAEGNKQWVVAYHNLPPTANASIRAVVRTQQGGVIGVGEFSIPAAGVQQLFVAQVEPDGTPGGYQSYQIVGQNGWAAITDVATIVGDGHSRIVGTVRNFKFCITANCLAQLNAVVLSAVLDEATLNLSSGVVLWDTTAQFTTAASLIVGMPREAFFVGGQVMWTKNNVFMPGFREALWIQVAQGANGIVGKRYGDGDGPFETNLLDLDRAVAGPNPAGFVSAVEIYKGGGTYSGENVVRTDVQGDSGSCQSTPPMFQTTFTTWEIGRRSEVRTWDLQRFKLEASTRRLTSVPCTQTEGARRGSRNAATSVAAGGPSKCLHDPCVPGFALGADCGPEVAAVCAADPRCCLVGWDDACVLEVSSASPASAAPPGGQLCAELPHATPTATGPFWIPCSAGFCPSISASGEK